MRTTADRIRHAISFEIIGLLIVVPLGAMGFGIHFSEIGVVAIVATTIAMIWNFIYNLGFDCAMRRWRGTLEKSIAARVLHALLFELGVVVFTLPFIVLYLGTTIREALILETSLMLFYLVYTFVFNLAYDWIFPVPSAP